MKTFSEFLEEQKGNPRRGGKGDNKKKRTRKVGSSDVNKVYKKSSKRTSDDGTDGRLDDLLSDIRGDTPKKTFSDAKEDRKEKHEKKKAIGKAGVKELKKTQKGNKTQRRMESGARAQHEKKKSIGKAGEQVLRQTQAANKADNKPTPSPVTASARKGRGERLGGTSKPTVKLRGDDESKMITPEEAKMREKQAAKRARKRQAESDAKEKDAAVEKVQKEKDAAVEKAKKDATKGSTNREANIEARQREFEYKSTRPVSTQDIKNRKNARVKKRFANKKSPEVRKIRREVLTKERSKTRGSGPDNRKKISDIRKEIKQKVRKATSADPVYKTGKGLITTKTSGRTSAVGGDISPGKGTSFISKR